mmetsp:Transcript_607/g.986  ORF Transcript_607/g.986 Transcript_607/m.986 type:complete len:100 (+) Transcript_607:375-674(+)
MMHLAPGRAVCGRSVVLGGITMIQYINREWGHTRVMIRIHFNSSKLDSIMVLGTTPTGNFFPMGNVTPSRLLALKKDRAVKVSGHGATLPRRTSGTNNI